MLRIGRCNLDGNDWIKNCKIIPMVLSGRRMQKIWVSNLLNILTVNFLSKLKEIMRFSAKFPCKTSWIYSKNVLNFHTWHSFLKNSSCNWSSLYSILFFSLFLFFLCFDWWVNFLIFYFLCFFFVKELPWFWFDTFK